MKNKLAILLLPLLLTGTLSADWLIKQEPLPDISLMSRILDNKIVVRLKSPSDLNGMTYLFYSIDKGPRSVAGLASSEYWLVTNVTTGIFRLDPPENGKYHFSAAVLTASKHPLQRYVFIYGSNSVRINHVTNELGLPKTGQATGVRFLGDRSNFNGFEADPGTNAGVGEPSKSELKKLNDFVNRIREFNLKVRTRYFQKKSWSTLDVMNFMVEYTAITSELDSIYFVFMTKNYNHRYIPAINKEYLVLTESVRETYKKIREFLKKDL